MPSEPTREWMKKNAPEALAKWDAEQSRAAEAGKWWGRYQEAVRANDAGVMLWHYLSPQEQKAWSKFLAELRAAWQAETPKKPMECATTAEELAEKAYDRMGEDRVSLHSDERDYKRAIADGIRPYLVPPKPKRVKANVRKSSQGWEWYLHTGRGGYHIGPECGTESACLYHLNEIAAAFGAEVEWVDA